jgi:hypothetical protein
MAIRASLRAVRQLDQRRVVLRNSQDLWIGVSRGFLIISLVVGSFDRVVVGSFDELAVLEAGAGADERDEVGCVDRAPALLG